MRKKTRREILSLARSALLILYVVMLLFSLSYCIANRHVLLFKYNIIVIFAVVLGVSCILGILGVVFMSLQEKNQQRAISLIKSYRNTTVFQKPAKTPEKCENNELIQAILQLDTYVSRLYSEQILTKQAELIALQSQINPHFLYNTLDSIRGQALQENMPQLAEMTEALSTFFRYSISTKDDFVTLEQEIKNVKNYFTIQQYRFGNRFRMRFVCNPEDQPLIFSIFLPKLTLQPIIENAIFHGLEPKECMGTITVRADITDKRLLLSVSDDGVGMDEATLSIVNERLYKGSYGIPKNTRATGIALSNVNSRIRLYFGDEYGLNINSTKNMGTDVNIVLPIIQNEEYMKQMGRGNS